MKVSQKTVQKWQMKTSHLGQFTFCFTDRNCSWTSPRHNWRVRFVQTSVWWWYHWLQCCREKARKRHCLQCKKDEKRLLVVEPKRLCMHCANILSSVEQSISQLDQVKWTNEISSQLKKINYIFPKLNLRGYLGKIFGTEHLPQQFWRSNDFCILTFWCKLWRREFWNSPWHISNWKSQVKTSTNTAFYVIKYFLSIFVCLMLLLMEFIWFLMVFEGFWQ